MSEMTQNIQDIQDAHKRHTLWPEGQELGKLIAIYYYKAPLGRIPDYMSKPFQYRAGAYMLSYSKGE